ncbi:MAG: hypothetical protein LBD18_03520 [Treponema sp.]|nr:hypothetical protein [Treponema sp.]
MQNQPGFATGSVYKINHLILFPVGGDTTNEQTSREILLTQEKRRELKTFTGSGKLLKRADIILALDTREGRKPAKEADSAGHSGVSCQTIQNGKKDFVTVADITARLQRKKREPPPIPAKLTETRIIAVDCGQPPQGYPTGN